MNYHLIPIGPNCNVAITLRNMKIRTVSYPWDWIRDSTIIDIIEVLKNKDTFNVSTWNCFTNMKYKMPHDYQEDNHNKSELLFEGGDVIEKYKRRFKRFFEHIYDNVPTYLLRFGDNKDIEELQSILPNSCKILYLQDGHPDSVITHYEIKKHVGVTNDPYGQILTYIVEKQETQNLKYPLRRIDILELIHQRDSKLDSYAEKVFLTDIQEFESEPTFLHFTFTQMKKITGIDYALL